MSQGGRGSSTQSSSPFLEELLATLLEKDPEKRLGSAGELVELLERGESSTWWREREAAVKAGGPALPARLHGLRESPFVGRESELELLRSLWRDACAGRGRVVLVEGEGGVGKSRLVEELLREVAHEGAEVHLLYGSYTPGAVGVAAGALAQALIDHFGAGALEAELLRRLPVMASVVPQVAALLDGGAPAGATPFSAETLHAVFGQVAASLAAERPTVWVVEDLHHTTAEDRSHLLALGRVARDRRLLIIGTNRAGLPAQEMANLTQLEHARHVQLGRLRPEDVVRLIQRHVPWHTIAEEVGARVARKSDGNPYFALEILRDLRGRGLLAPPPRGTPYHLASIEVPSTLRELLLARLAGLPAEQRALLDFAAVQGFELDIDLLERVRRQPRLQVLEVLAEIERNHRLVRATGSGFRFDHRVLQEIIYDAMPPALRREYHALLAAAYAEQQRSESPPATEVNVFLARHFLLGGEAEQAIPHLLPALDQLGALYQHETSLQLAELALGALRENHADLACELLLRQARTYELRGRRPEAAAVAAEALAIAEGLGDAERRIRASIRLAVSELASGSFAAARDRLETCREAAEAARAPRLLAEALTVSGSLELLSGDLVASQWAYDRLAVVAQRLEDRRLEGQALVGSGTVLLASGDHAAATHRFAAAIDLFRSASAREHEAQAMTLLGVAFRHSRPCRYDLARQHLTTSLATFREMGFKHGELMALTNLALLDLEEGRITEAEQKTRELESLARALGSSIFQGYALLHRGECERAAGRAGAAKEILTSALQTFRSNHMPRPVAESALALGRVLLELGEREAALPLLEEAAGLVDLHRLDEPGPLPAAWLASTGVRDPASVVVDRGPMLLRGEAHLRLYSVTGAATDLAAAEREISAVAATLDPVAAATFWRCNPAARRLRERVGDSHPDMGGR